VHPELVSKQNVRAISMLLVGEESAAIEERTGLSFTPERRGELSARYAGKSKGELKLMGLQLVRYEPDALRAAMAVGLLLSGFLLTGKLGKRT